MASAPAYQLTESSEIVELYAERYGGLAARPAGGASISEENLKEETPLGQVWVRERFTRFKASLTFLVTAEQLEVFKTLDEDVDGARLSFTYFPDSTDLSTSYGVRKEDSFLPKELDGPVMVDGEPVPIYEYTMELMGEAVMHD